MTVAKHANVSAVTTAPFTCRPRNIRMFDSVPSALLAHR